MKKIIDHLKENWIRHGFETLVVTVGILGAFTLNNWNEGRKEENERIRILTNIRDELVLDTAMFDERFAFYTLLVNKADSVLNDQMTKETIKKNKDLFVKFFPVIIRTKGHNQYKSNTTFHNSGDSLSLMIDTYYEFCINEFDENSGLEKSYFFETYELWEKYDWYDEFMREEITDPFVEYQLNSIEYRNRVAFLRILSLENISDIRKAEQYSKELITEINKIIE